MPGTQKTSGPMSSPTGGFPLKQIVLDTETTGLNPKLGDRIVELGATRVHGLTREDLAAKPRFREVAREFLDFVRGAELLIHNAEFDVDFLNMELELAGFPTLRHHVAAITDTLLLAKELHPGKKNSLDALCERYFVDNSRRTLHGAFADALLLGECYLAMTCGQESLMIELEAPAAAAGAGPILDVSKLIVQRPSPEELAAHEQYLDAMEKEAKGTSLWRKLAGG